MCYSEEVDAVPSSHKECETRQDAALMWFPLCPAPGCPVEVKMQLHVEPTVGLQPRSFEQYAHCKLCWKFDRRWAPGTAICRTCYGWVCRGHYMDEGEQLICVECFVLNLAGGLGRLPEHETSTTPWTVSGPRPGLQ